MPRSFPTGLRRFCPNQLSSAENNVKRIQRLRKTGLLSMGAVRKGTF